MQSLWSWKSVFALVAVGSLNLSAEDWPQWRGPDRNGISRETGFLQDWPNEGPKQLWKAKVGVGWSSMSIAKGQVYTMGNINEVDHVYALDAETGKEIWVHKYPCSSKDPNGFPGPRMTPTVDGDRVYIVSRQGHFFCLNTKDGQVVWSADFQKDFGAKVPTWGFSGSPLVDGDLLIVEVGAKGAAAVAFNKLTGKVLWKNGDDGVGYSSPVVYEQNGGRAVLILHATGLVARNIKGGGELWRHGWKTMYDVNSATPVVDGTRVFISSGYNRGCALVDFKDNQPKVIYEHKNMRNHMNPCVLYQGHLYGFDEGELRCITWETGEVKWNTRDFGKGSLIMAAGKLIVWGDRGQLGLVEVTPEKYNVLENVQVLGGRDSWMAPVLANGRIYVRSGDNLAALDVGGSQTASTGGGEGWTKLFAKDGVVDHGWAVRAWDDVKNPGPEGAQWKVIDGVLHGGEPRGNWLVSEKEYGDFTMKWEFLLGERGNSGCGLRFPAFGDPAFDGLELQMVAPKYYPPEMTVPPNELTGSLYRAVAPAKQLLKEGEWNSYEVTLKGSHVKVVLNGQEVVNTNLDEHNTIIKRHNGQDAVALKDRPRKGRIGFQELSRGGAHVQLRNIMIKESN